MAPGKSKRAITQTKRQSVVTPHGPDPLLGGVSIHHTNGAKKIVLTKVRGSSPERWEIEALYDKWEEI